MALQMIAQSTLVIFIVPAIGMMFVGALCAVTGLVDRRALRRADASERAARM
jgi:hypothetical protein